MVIDMGVDTKLYVPKRFGLNDIKTVIEKHLNTTVKVKDCSKTSIGMFIFTFPYKEQDQAMFVHSDAGSPLGSFTMLSMRHDNKSEYIMRTIGSVLGGLLHARDCTEKYEELRGMLDEEDGLSYFVKYAAIHNELNSNDDIEGLVESIKKWRKKNEA